MRIGRPPFICKVLTYDFVQVGDGDTDHYCWQRPEDMTTSRQAYKVDRDHPGSDVAGETAAAMAAASIVFRDSNPHYAHLLLHHAQQVRSTRYSSRHGVCCYMVRASLLLGEKKHGLEMCWTSSSGSTRPVRRTQLWTVAIEHLSICRLLRVLL
jgi:hypothetical protein